MTAREKIIVRDIVGKLVLELLISDHQYHEDNIDEPLEDETDYWMRELDERIS